MSLTRTWHNVGIDKKLSKLDPLMNFLVLSVPHTN
jgi:hypothetical protein